MPKALKVLAIETSCDETAVCLLSASKTKVNVEHDLVSSQIPIHQKYGGVVPEVAARSHVAETVSLLMQVLGTKGLKAFDAIAVTSGPGLATALRVGIEAGRVLAMLTGKPIVGVNHLEGHLASAWLNTENRKHWKFPMLALIVSGGHTELVLMNAQCKYRIVGQTRDDAAGEAFDKSAKLMGLPYPGGPHIAKLALEGDAKAFDLPRPMMNDGSLDFSFSGLKTAVRQTWEGWPIATEVLREKAKRDLAASVQQAIVDVLVAKTLTAAKKYKVKGVLLVGGVSANALLRETLGAALQEQLPTVTYMPSDKAYITDNAAMIAAAGYWRLTKGEKHDWKKIEAKPEWNI
ncbi:tRNA (adenosine(37)-N6)-threonylcarbamoyltransferase complex transferase subunit TsaD [Patescibacteria group bacterium]|jgi:N6-L-threonylcarbamoyladenine synthase|nr:tRNA (adenosine(37)-N6)-threonylcarbamoyltransferase complex transferase subunit TsaD [Patescibacteria group bacterium]